jgi:hypothetical protein
MPAKQLILLAANSGILSKRALKLLDNQTDFDSAIRSLISRAQNDTQGLEFVAYRRR